MEIENKFQKKIKILSIIIIFFSLTLNFSFNYFKVLDNNWFNSFQLDSEQLVISKLINSRENGILIHGAFLGYSNGKYHTEEKNTQTAYQVYEAQTGLQGIIFSIIDKILDLSDITKIKIYYLMNSGLMAACIAAIILFFINEFGIIAGMLSFLGVLYSPWLGVGAKNLYWVFWTHLLPIAVLFFYLSEKIKKADKNLLKKVAIIVLFISYFKFLSGFEYASQFLIGIELPIIYFIIKDSWEIKKSIKNFFIIGIFSILGFMMALLTTIIQISYFRKISIIQSISNLFLRVAYRTGLNKENYNIEDIYKESLEISRIEVLRKYLFESKILFDYTFFQILLFLVAITIIYFYYSNLKNRKLLALNVITWISLLGPISWIILAKGHSYIHTHINYILFNIPFTIFMCLFIGAILDEIILKIGVRK